MSEAWLYLKSSLANGIYNLDSSRCRNASLDKRSVGWTETWGDEDAQEEDNAWSFENELVISRSLSTTYPQMHITLVQHRPAWFEQALMRFAKVPHIVVNSPYTATEATGPLPFLRDLQPSKPAAVLVGRRHPASPNKNKNCILDYLQSEGYISSLDESLTPSQKALSNGFSALIQHLLEPALLSLHFGDSDAWNQVYRKQYIQASSNSNLTPLWSKFQAWSIRNVALKQQVDKKWSVEESMSIARDAYASLETQLQGHDYLLHTTKPTTIDALLWAHLADALCDVHLVTVLADFPNLVKYFEGIYQEYFRVSTDNDEEWKVWNQEQNLSSAFQQLPVEESSEPFTFHDALELMQSVSVHTHDLQEVLSVAKEKRLHDEATRSVVPPKQSTLYRWRMGGDILPPKKETAPTAAEQESEETPLQQKYRKEHKQNDELWLSAVVAVTAIAVFFGATTRS